MYIVKTLILVIIFLAVIYVFLFRRTRARKSKDFDSVREYHDTYLNHKSHLTSGYNYRIKSNSSNTYMRMSGDSGTHRTNSITKYNSSVDYREK